jgi:hypothetical protein
MGLVAPQESESVTGRRDFIIGLSRRDIAKVFLITPISPLNRHKPLLLAGL